MAKNLTHEELAAQSMLDKLPEPKRLALQTYALRNNKTLVAVINESLDAKSDTILNARKTAGATTLIGSLG